MELQDILAALVAEMPAFSSSVTRIMELTPNINCAPKDMVAVIDHDPATDSPMRDCVIAANLLTKKLAFGQSGNPVVAKLPAPVKNRMANDLDGLLEELGGLTHALENTRVFASA